MNPRCLVHFILFIGHERFIKEKYQETLCVYVYIHTHMKGTIRTVEQNILKQIIFSKK